MTKTTETITIQPGSDALTLYDEHGHKLQQWHGRVDIYHEGRDLEQLDATALSQLVAKIEQHASLPEKIINGVRGLLHQPRKYEVPMGTLAALCPTDTPTVLQASTAVELPRS